MMDAHAEDYQEEVEEGDYDEEDYTDEDEQEEEDGLVEEVDDDDAEEIGAEAAAAAADDDDDAEPIGPGAAAPGAPGGAGGPGGQGQMLYIPGVGYIPLSSLGNLAGLQGLAGRAGGGAAAPGAPAGPEGERDWAGLRSMPDESREAALDLCEKAAAELGVRELTVLLLGRGGAGKSSLANALLGERAAPVAALNAGPPRVAVLSRRAALRDGEPFVLHVVDAPSPLDGDAPSDARLEAVGRALAEHGRPVHAVLWVDRLDQYAVDALDAAALAAVTRVLGAPVWRNALLVLTRASDGAQPLGAAFAPWVDARARALRAALGAAGAEDADAVPVALAENSSRCAVNGAGEKVVPAPDGDLAWVPDLFDQLADVALAAGPGGGFRWRPAEAARAADPNRRRKWLIPLVLAAQVAAKLLLDRVLEDDGCRGDEGGPFDAQTVEERRREAREARRAAERRRAKAKAARAADDGAAGGGGGGGGGGGAFGLGAGAALEDDDDGAGEELLDDEDDDF